MFKKKRSGFTLVELLIVIIILASLAATMTMNSGNAVVNAKAETIVQNLSTLCNAAVIYYQDHPNDASVEGFKNLRKTYLGGLANSNSPKSVGSTNGVNQGYSDIIDQGTVKYGLIMGDKPSGSNTYLTHMWYARCDFANDKDREAIKAKLAELAPSARLIFMQGTTHTLYTGQTWTTGGTVQYKVFMRAR